jgi:hypothetical protein
LYSFSNCFTKKAKVYCDNGNSKVLKNVAHNLLKCQLLIQRQLSGSSKNDSTIYEIKEYAFHHQQHKLIENIQIIFFKISVRLQKCDVHDICHLLELQENNLKCGQTLKGKRNESEYKSVQEKNCQVIYYSIFSVLHILNQDSVYLNEFLIFKLRSTFY